MNSRVNCNIFIRNRCGNVAILFGFALIPIVAAIAGALDYSNAARTHTQLQDIFDAAALAGATAHDQTDRVEVVKKYIQANAITRLNGQQIENLEISFDDAKSKVTVSGDVNLNMMLMAALGRRTLPVGNSSTAVWTCVPQRIALVLDTTGSLRDSGVDGDLRGAATSFLETLSKGSPKTSSVYVSLVPFASMVNVGADKVSWLSSKYNASNYLPGKWDGCVYERAAPDDVTVRAPTKGEFDPHIWPKDFSAAFGFNDWAGEPASKFKNGVKDPDKTPGEESIELLGPNVGCMAPVIPLTTDMNALKARIQDLKMLSGSGGTMLQEGLVWGWRTLAPEWAGFWRNGAIEPQDRMTGGTIVFLSDGSNDWYAPTEKPFYYGLGITAYGKPEERRSGIGPMKSAVAVAAEALGTTANDPNLKNKITTDRDREPDYQVVTPALHDSQDKSDDDATSVWDQRFLAVCSAAKQSGLTIYTIAFGPDSDGAKVLRKCATSTKHFFRSENRSKLEAAFKNISGASENFNTVRLVN